jgi:hypothetical protein
MNPTITQEGQRAKTNIANARTLRNAGVSSVDTRRALRNPNQLQGISSAMANVPNQSTRLNGAPTNMPVAGPTVNKSTGFSVTLPDTVPAEALNGNIGRTDVRGMRDNLEQQNIATQELDTQFNDLTNSINSASSLSFNDPDKIINRLTLGRSITPNEAQRENVFNTQMSGATNYSNELNTARTSANESLGLETLVGKRAKTREDYANREIRLDNDLKKLAENAQKAGVDRAVVEDRQNQIKSQALEDLGNLAAIEAAQSGSIQEARDIVDDIMADKKTAFELQNNQLQAQINFLNTKVGEDNAERAAQLQIALDERKTQQAAILAKQTAIKKLAVDAAAENADSATVNGILAAQTEEEAIRLASPFIGRLDRLAQEANTAQSWASAAASNTNRLLALAEAGDPDAIAKLKFDPRTVEEEVDPVTRRQLEGGLESGTNLIRLANKYKTIIDNYGYTNEFAGDTQLLGEIDSLRALMTAEYKKAETLGTLDAGVLALMSQIVGEKPTSGFFTPLTNATGRKSDKLSSQLGTFIENMTVGQASTKARLGIEPTVDFSVITPEEDTEINTAYGVNTSTPAQGGFNPQTYFK